MERSSKRRSKSLRKKSPRRRRNLRKSSPSQLHLLRRKTSASISLDDVHSHYHNTFIKYFKETYSELLAIEIFTSINIAAAE